MTGVYFTLLLGSVKSLVTRHWLAGQGKRRKRPRGVSCLLLSKFSHFSDGPYHASGVRLEKGYETVLVIRVGRG